MTADAWKEEAACKGKTVRFFVAAFEPLAKATCAGCPVRVTCQEYGRHEPHGVFGGLNPEERRRIHNARRRAA